LLAAPLVLGKSFLVKDGQRVYQNQHTDGMIGTLMKQTTKELKHSTVEYLDSKPKPRQRSTSNHLQALTKAITKKIPKEVRECKQKQQKRGRPQGTTNQIREKKTVAAQKAA